LGSLSSGLDFGENTQFSVERHQMDIKARETIEFWPFKAFKGRTDLFLKFGDFS
jgi:hypothetical protein